MVMVILLIVMALVAFGLISYADYEAKAARSKIRKERNKKLK